MTPRATYRIQFTKAFGFDDAARLAPYLAKLGVSHLYASPYLKARPGSTHGYDIVDHNALNPELGDAAAFGRLDAALKANGLKQILDFVPNHVGIGGADNPFWLDVLAWGPASPYAGWFDIDWSPDRVYLHDKVLVPFLGEQLGAAVAAGKLALKFDPDAGTFAVWAYDAHKLPVSPTGYADILGHETAALERLGDDFAHLDQWRPNERERAEALQANLAALAADNPTVRSAIEAAVARHTGQPGDPASWDRLAALMAKQFWRLAHFRVAADDINYRRFFNIADLAGLRMELPAVFDHAHRLVFDLMARGIVDGLRIDHIDGLLDPKAYLDQLRAAAPADPDFYLVVEKILGTTEPLRADWPVDGTTGYEVTNLLTGLLIDTAGEAGFDRTYAAFTGETDGLPRILRRSKKQIMDNEMASELASLARAAGRIALQTGMTADFTRNSLRRAIREVVAAFPVYRTYVDFDGAASEEDRETIRAAVAGARAHGSAIDPSVYDFLEKLLTGELVATPNSGFSRSAVLRFAMRVQQYSGPVMAKGLEDTAFYRYNRFLALNEVGGDPRRFGITVASFHTANAPRAADWPHAMLGTSTHDTKRGEDVRARLAVLSEMPDQWAEAVTAWSRSLRGDLTPDTDAVPDRNDEYALYQTLVGTVPPALLDPGRHDPQGWSDYATRVKGAMQKAMREAKQHTTWAAPNETYESGMATLVDRALTGDNGAAFRAAFLPFASRVARFGIDNSLVQLALKLTIPGVPDIYQGTEGWDLSLVDPDNRRPVDFATRLAQLDSLEAAFTGDRVALWQDLRAGWADGRIKLALAHVLLALRRDAPALFSEGSYTPLELHGPGSDTVLAFAREVEGRRLIVAVALRPARRSRTDQSEAGALTLPPGSWSEILTGRNVAGEVRFAPLFDTLPVAVLMAHADG